MLLVDDDQAEARYGREHRRARAHADPGLALAQDQPLGVALGGAKARVQHGYGLAEAFDEAAHDLGRERYLRHEDDGPPALLERRGGRLQVDLCLSPSR